MSSVRTTVNLPSQLFEESKVFALKHKTTLTQLIQDGLKLRLNHASAAPKRSLSAFVASLQPTQKNPSSLKQYYHYLKERYGKTLS